MKKTFLTSLVLMSSLGVFAQDKAVSEKDKDGPALQKESGIGDRAAGTHNTGNIGLFFENRGKLYPRRLTQGPSGEFPTNSGKHYIYRVNPYVGIPGNVIQGRYSTNEEWEAVGGFHNPEYTQIAFSDNPRTWPSGKWPVTDAQGNPVIKSDQDSYCVYDDSKNTRGVLGFEIAQTGYAYGSAFAKNILFYKFELKNKSTKKQDSVYFALYCDVDVGNISGGDPEYNDDLIGFDKGKNLVYFYDSKGYSKEWPDSKTGYFGFSFVQTPATDEGKTGVTDMHYFLYNDDDIVDTDTLHYQRISSSPILYNSALGSKFFHVTNPSDLHYDDPAKQPAAGHDVGAFISAGPYTLEPGQVLTFYTAMLAGDNLPELIKYQENSLKMIGFDFEISKPPVTPTVSVTGNDGSATVYWDNAAEKSRDSFSGQYDFEGYRVYRSQNKGVSWENLADFDAVNKIGLNTGLQYSYTDTKVTNGFEYWYSVTAYDRGDSVTASLESPKGTTTDAKNLKAVTPSSAAAGYRPVSGTGIVHAGTGKSNYSLLVSPADQETLTGNSYQVRFTYTTRKDLGDLDTKVEVVIKDSTKAGSGNYAVEWLDVDQIRLINLATGDEIPPTPKLYRSGAQYNFNSGLSVKLTDTTTNVLRKPQPGDYLSVNFSSLVVRNQTDTVASPRPFLYGKPVATQDGVIITAAPQPVVRKLTRVGGTDPVTLNLTATSDTAAIKNGTYLLSTDGTGFKDGEGFTHLLIRDAGGTVVVRIDSLFSGDTFAFLGLEGSLEFPKTTPPPPGTIFSAEIEKIQDPTLRDKWNFSIAGSAVLRDRLKAEMADIKVVPNPYVVSSLYEPEFGELRKEPLRQIQFINLPNSCTIYIFSVAADLVKTLHHQSLTGTEIWDLKAEGGREVAPGVYLYVVKADGVEFKSRFAIIK
ncbi:MAG: hypothetical protein L6Q77_02075 [Bacteroidetes bacterium]|nr:hypothetical protein [Bacteroidota bacterium]